jgi:hypothetical protein
MEWYPDLDNHLFGNMKAVSAILGFAFIVIIVAILLPALRPTRSIRNGPVCSVNLRLIQAAKLMHAEDYRLTNDASFTKQQLLPYGFGRGWPRCPRGGEYSIGTLHQSPSCSYPDHAHLTVPTEQAHP